jgi:hypothetical protein
MPYSFLAPDIHICENPGFPFSGAHPAFRIKEPS